MSETHMSRAIEQSEAAVTVIDDQRALAPLTPMAMIDRALASGAGVETLEKLMALQERYDANQARKAFDEAMAAAKSEIPPIRKNREVDFTSQKGRTHYKHEDLAEVARTVNPILGRHGLSYRFRTSSPVGEPITVTCIVSHRLGHAEENTLCAGRDETGNKNSIQAIGSTLTYLQRMTLKAALGLSASEDDDGAAAGGGEEYDTSPWTERIMNATHDGALNSIATDLKAATDIPPEAMRALRAAWAGRKKLLASGASDHE